MPRSLSVWPQNIRCLKRNEHIAHAHTRVHEIEDDNMSITRSISVAQTDSRFLKANCGLLLLPKPCETVQGKTTMISPRFLSVRTKRARHTKTYVRSEIEGGNMSITRSISFAQTDNRFLKSNCHVHYCFYWSPVKLSKGRQLGFCLVF